MPGHVHWKIGATDDVGILKAYDLTLELILKQGSQRKQTPSDPTGVDIVQQVLHAVPPRSITGAKALVPLVET